MAVWLYPSAVFVVWDNSGRRWDKTRGEDQWHTEGFDVTPTWGELLYACKQLNSKRPDQLEALAYPWAKPGRSTEPLDQNAPANLIDDYPPDDSDEYSLTDHLIYGVEAMNDRLTSLIKILELRLPPARDPKHVPSSGTPYWADSRPDNEW